MANQQKEVQEKLTKGLIDFIVLQKLTASPAHGYEIITYIRKSFGIYLGPSTVYPLLASLEKKHFVKSGWDMTSDRPRKVFRITSEGQSMLNFAENSLALMCQKISNTTDLKVEAKTPNQLVIC